MATRNCLSPVLTSAGRGLSSPKMRQGLQMGWPLVHHVYMVDMIDPGPLNDISPLNPVTSIQGYSRRTSSGGGDTPYMRSEPQQHPALVLSVDSGTNTAVILMGTTFPDRPHLYVPWQGTPHLARQPPYSLHMSGALNRQGYLNFSHCVRVKVIKVRNERGMTTPGLAFDRKVAFCEETSLPGMQTPYLEEEEVEKLRRLHGAYWEGGHYDITGVAAYDEPEEGEVESQEEGEDYGGQEGPEPAEDFQGLYPHQVLEVVALMTEAQLDLQTAIRRYKTTKLLEVEEERNNQLDLMGGLLYPSAVGQQLPICAFFSIPI